TGAAPGTAGILESSDGGGHAAGHPAPRAAGRSVALAGLRGGREARLLPGHPRRPPVARARPDDGPQERQGHHPPPRRPDGRDGQHDVRGRVRDLPEAEGGLPRGGVWLGALPDGPHGREVDAGPRAAEEEAQRLPSRLSRLRLGRAVRAHARPGDRDDRRGPSVSGLGLPPRDGRRRLHRAPRGVAQADRPRRSRPPQDPERDGAPGVCAALHRGGGVVGGKAMNVTTAQELDDWLAERHMQGHWKHMAKGPEPKPYLWRWEDIYAGLMKATDVVPMSDTPRRTIQLKNPSLGHWMTNTIHISVQCVMPGEVAEAHRHNAAAIRFVVQGAEGAFTVVEGEALPMGDGDLVTTPNWTWHDHYNDGDKPVIWLDGLDIRLVSLAKMFSEPYSEPRQAIQWPTGFSGKTLGHVRPPYLKREQHTPPFRYAWA